MKKTRICFQLTSLSAKKGQIFVIEKTQEKGLQFYLFFQIVRIRKTPTPKHSRFIVIFITASPIPIR